MVICEAAALFREALATVVRSRGHRVACSVGVLADAVAAIERCDADVLLLNAALTDPNSLGRLREKVGLRVLLLTDWGGDGPAAAALEAGLADAVFDHAVALVTLERAVNGQLPAAPPLRRTVASPRCPDWLLTAREGEVIGLLLIGRSTDAIALALGVARSTVHTHVQSILRKLGAQSRIEAVSIYLAATTAPVG